MNSLLLLDMIVLFVAQFLNKLSFTGRDEELLAKGLELNDNIQNELAKYDAIALDHVRPTEVINSKPQLSEVPNSSLKGDENSWFRSSPRAVPCAPLTFETKHVAEEEEEEDDEFAQLARRSVTLTLFTTKQCTCNKHLFCPTLTLYYLYFILLMRVNEVT